MQEALAAQKEEFARREVRFNCLPPLTRACRPPSLPKRHALVLRLVMQEAFRRREESLRRKDLDLQTTLIHFNKTVTVCARRLPCPR